jgi:multiple sugar transport system substrate-binding protein
MSKQGESKMQKKVFIAALLIALMLSFGVVMAQDTGDLSVVDPTGQTIVYWHEWDGAQLTAIDEIIANFNETNEYGITVETVAQGNNNNIEEAMNAAITSGDFPNLVGGFSNTAQGYYLDEVLVPLDPYVNDPTWGFSEHQL